MPADDALLFLDANTYLDLFRVALGKKSLEAIAEQAKNIFVPRQVVEEVQRNKVRVAQVYVEGLLGDPEQLPPEFPDHLFGSDTEARASMKDKPDRKKIKKDLKAWASGIIDDISISRDDVSRALALVFGRAVDHTPQRLLRAKERKERGNPPGKERSLTVGDELIWEQILDQFKGKKRLWLITGDTDYRTDYNGRLILNAFLRDEIARVSPEGQVFLFGADEVMKGIRDFVEKTNTKANCLPTEAEQREIEKEREALPPLGWLDNSADVAAGAIVSGNIFASGMPRYIISGSGPLAPWWPKSQVLGGPPPTWGGIIAIVRDASGFDWAHRGVPRVEPPNRLMQAVYARGSRDPIGGPGPREVQNGDRWLAGLQAQGYTFDPLDLLGS
jgi:hypothetical protein